MKSFVTSCLLPLVQSDYRVYSCMCPLRLFSSSFATKIIVVYFQISFSVHNESLKSFEISFFMFIP